MVQTVEAEFAIMKKVIFCLMRKVNSALSLIGLKKRRPIVICDYLYRMLKPKGYFLIECQDSRMYIDSSDEVIGATLLTQGIWEEYQSELFKDLIKPGMVVIDIGANIGYYTLIAAKLVGDSGRVYAFEPEPNSYRILVKNIAINGYSNVVAIRKALSNQHGRVKLFLDKYTFGTPSFAEHNVPHKAGFVEVETETLDNFLPDGKVDLIKIDAQGAEGLILDGARKILRTNESLKIIMEFWPYGLSNLKSDSLNLLNELERCGFRIKLLDDTSGKMEEVGTLRIMELSSKLDKWGKLDLFMEKLSS